MRIIVLFSGQGAQRREHVARLLADIPADIAGPLQGAVGELGLALSELTDAQLAANRIAQPVICAYQLALWREAAPHLPPPALVAGYSLGELAAFACAGAYAAGDAVTLAAQRARLMDEATANPCGLLAVLGLNEATLRARCEPLGAEIAIRNGPAHFIVGGTREALASLEKEAARAGASKITLLCVTTPSHTAMLKEAAVRFGGYLQPLLKGKLELPVLSGINADIIRSAHAAATALAAQICTRLDWAACLETIVAFRPDAVLEIGPGNALSKMLLELEPRLEARSTDEFRSIAAVVRWVLSKGRSA